MEQKPGPIARVVCATVFAHCRELDQAIGELAASLLPEEAGKFRAYRARAITAYRCCPALAAQRVGASAQIACTTSPVS
jgi:hypothetical protein